KVAGPNEHWFGLEFGDDYPGDYYQFALNGRGSVKFAKRMNDAWHEGLQRDRLPAANPGNAVNLLKVVRRTGMLHLFVNGLHAINVEDSGVRNGRLGFVFGPGLRIGFSDLCIHAVDPVLSLQKALEHWNRLEMPEANRLLE